MRICKEILKISTFVGIFCMFCPLCTCILQFYVSLNCYMPKCVSYFPFSCGTLQKSKNWFDVLNFGFSHIHGYSGSTVIRDSRVGNIKFLTSFIQAKQSLEWILNKNEIISSSQWSYMFSLSLSQTFYLHPSSTYYIELLSQH